MTWNDDEQPAQRRTTRYTSLPLVVLGRRKARTVWGNPKTSAPGGGIVA